MAAGLRAAIARAIAACTTQREIAQAENALRWQAIAEALGVATAGAQLDRETVLAELCVEVVYEQLTFPQVPQAGVPALLDLRLAIALRGSGTVLLRDLLVLATATGATPVSHSGLTDAQGGFQRSFTAVGGRPVTLRIRACGVSEGYGVHLGLVCQEAVVVRGELVVEPDQITVAGGATRQFTAALLGLPTTAVTWSATGGTITPGGLYTAGNIGGIYSVTAISTADPSLQGSASVEVTVDGAGSVVLRERTWSAVVDCQAALGSLGPPLSGSGSLGTAPDGFILEHECAAGGSGASVSVTMHATSSMTLAGDDVTMVHVAGDHDATLAAGGGPGYLPNHTNIRSTVQLTTEIEVVGGPVPYAFTATASQAGATTTANGARAWLQPGSGANPFNADTDLGCASDDSGLGSWCETFGSGTPEQSGVLAPGIYTFAIQFGGQGAADDIAGIMAAAEATIAFGP